MIGLDNLKLLSLFQRLLSAAVAASHARSGQEWVCSVTVVVAVAAAAVSQRLLSAAVAASHARIGQEWVCSVRSL